MNRPCIRFVLAAGMAVVLLFATQYANAGVQNSSSSNTASGASSTASSEIPIATAEPTGECNITTGLNCPAGGAVIRSAGGANTICPGSDGTGTTLCKGARTDSSPGMAVTPIDAWNICRFVNNSSPGTSYFIPYNSPTEWIDFLTNAPGNSHGYINAVYCALPHVFTVAPDVIPTDYWYCGSPVPVAGDTEQDSLPYWPVSAGPITKPAHSYTCTTPGTCDPNDPTLCGLPQTWVEKITVTYNPLAYPVDTDPSWDPFPTYSGVPPTPNPPLETYVAGFVCPNSCDYGGGIISPTTCTVSQNNVTVDPSFCAGQTQTCPATSQCVTVSLTADPPSITPPRPSTLTWGISGSPTSCIASNDPSGQWSGAVSTVGGAAFVTPSASTTYVLSCTDINGIVETAQATVAVVPVLQCGAYYTTVTIPIDADDAYYVSYGMCINGTGSVVTYDGATYAWTCTGTNGASIPCDIIVPPSGSFE